MDLPGELLEAAESLLESNCCKCCSLLLAIVFCGRGWQRRGRVVCGALIPWQLQEGTGCSLYSIFLPCQQKEYSFNALHEDFA